MDIFTDASLNDKRKIAGIGMVFVWPNKPINFQIGNAYFETDNIETAELFAISRAIFHGRIFGPKNVRLFSDSIGALRKIQRVFHHPNQNQIHTINNPIQKRILYTISTSFQIMKDIDFSFHHIAGHQRKPNLYTNGYYNMLADHEASSARLLGEMIVSSPHSSCQPMESLVPEDAEQVMDSWIVSPTHISFHYEDKSTKPKLISRYTGRQKENTFRRVKHMSSSVHPRR